jgi:hypothetical protein
MVLRGGGLGIKLWLDFFLKPPLKPLPNENGYPHSMRRNIPT